MYYKTLVHINLFHDYFLDNGDKKFVNMNQADREKALINYNINKFIHFIPTRFTKNLIQNQRMICVFTKQGIKLLVTGYKIPVSGGTKYSPLIPVSKTSILTFLLYAKDIYFNNYTEISKSSNRLYLFSNSLKDFSSISTSVFSGKAVNDEYLLGVNDSISLVNQLATEERENKAVFFIHYKKTRTR